MWDDQQLPPEPISGDRSAPDDPALPGRMPSHHGPEESGERHPGAEEILRLLHQRASCRDFQDRPVPPEVLEPMLSAGARAASGGSLQPFSIIQIEEPETRRWLAERCGQPFMSRAPVHLLFCIDFHRLGRWAELEKAPFSAGHSFRHFWIGFQDTVICAQSIATAADGLGLGSVYIGTVLEFVVELRSRFSLPYGVFPVVLLCVGYPRSSLHPRRKLPLSVLVHREGYRDPDPAELLAAYGAKYDGLRIEPTEERRAILEDVCRTIGGEALVQAALERVRELGYINPVQRYFGLHYRADMMPHGNLEFLRILEESGFLWMR